MEYNAIGIEKLYENNETNQGRETLDKQINNLM